MKKVAVLGSTGSIGTQTLSVIRENPDKLNVHSLVAFSNEQKLSDQCKEFLPQYSALISREGEDCLTEAVKGCDICVVATRGIAALKAVIFCLDNGIDVALANKEVLVCAGDIVMRHVSKAKLIPVDSEHSAIMQCLRSNPDKKPQKILLTASGGPFWDKDLSEASAEEALRHPNWNMGQKITVDSATMMNKALEVVEAHHLFGVDAKDIEIVVHRQSIVHSMVQWTSGSVVAQLALPNMVLPISLALVGEGVSSIGNVNFEDLLTLTFEKCNYEKFPCARLGHEILQYPPLCATVMNAANDVCVESFLQGNLGFCDFYSTIKSVVDSFKNELVDVQLTVENVVKYDAIARKYTQNLILQD